MIQTSTSSKIITLIKSALAAAVLPVLFIYIMIAKPDYKIMNGLAHIVLPVANTIGDVITWPVRIIGDMVANMHELSTLRSENAELRVRLDAALADKHKCDIAINENDVLTRQIGITRQIPQRTVIADVIHENRALHHNTFMINRGRDDGVETGMVVVSTSNQFAGIIIDAGETFARVRAVTDSDTNIAVHVAGYEVYGFLSGNASSSPSVGLFSDPQFKPVPDMTLTTSGISGVLPSGIFVGKTKKNATVDVLQPGQLSRVIVLQFDTKSQYK
ncbi:MAG: rod shape-determining protein MreC [Alphaproteobacteria bacterium]|nr:rod shape-determining protein MreC [Alphaproteobacteria bacterium]